MFLENSGGRDRPPPILKISLSLALARPAQDCVYKSSLKDSTFVGRQRDRRWELWEGRGTGGGS